MSKIDKAVKFMIDTANDNSHGYDQTHRNGPDYDCSSLVATALFKAGFNVSPYSWTGNLESQLRKCGFKSCKPPWKAGDIHLNTKYHVCMSIDSKRIAQASINEKGTATGGKRGDQTGNEISIKPYYEYSKGWNVHLRYVEDKKKTNQEISKEVIQGKWGNGEERKKKLTEAGYNYNTIQKLVNVLVSDNKNEKIAKEVIAGLWGNGNERKIRLEKAGYNYEEIQNLVNAMLM